MSRLKELIAELCPDGVEYKPLGDVGQFLRGSSFQKKHFIEAGVPCIHYGQVHTRFGISTDHVVSYLRESFAARMKRARRGDLVIATTSEDDEAVGKATAWMGDFDVVVSNDAFIYRHELDPMYVAYFFVSDQFQTAKMPFITGSKVRRVSGDDMSKIRIPVPPIEVQREIVRILDSFQELDDALTAEIEAREKQLQGVLRESLGALGSNDVVTFGTVVDIYNGDRGKNYPAKSTLHSIGLPFVSGIDIADRKVSVDKLLYLSDDQYNRLRAGKIVSGDILFCIRGSIGKWGVFQFERGAIASSMVILRPKKQLDKSFLCAFLDSDYMRSQIYKNRAIGGASSMSATDLASFLVPLPSMSKQQMIAKRLDAMQQLIDELRFERDARRKQFAYYRDKLLSFPEKVTANG